MVAFSNRIGIPLSQINACGHEFAPGGGNYGGPPSFGGAPGGGGQYMQFQMPPQPNMQFTPEQHQNFGPPMQFIEPPPQNYIPNPGFGAFQPFPQGSPPGQFMYQPPPPTNQFGGYQPPQKPRTSTSSVIKEDILSLGHLISRRTMQLWEEEGRCNNQQRGTANCRIWMTLRRE